MVREFDALAKRIVYMLQQDARHTSASDIADVAGVSPSTVRKRITWLESNGYVEGYHLQFDYERAGYHLQSLFVCSAPIPDRKAIAEAAGDVAGVVSVREIMTGTENVHVEAVGTDRADLNRIGRDLNSLGLEIVDEDLIAREHVSPYHGFRGGSTGTD
jgi:DNA-binding Lrp family transcriptional regulator